MARETPEHVGRVARQATLQRGVEKGGSKNVYATDEDPSESVEEATDKEEDLQALCLLEIIENEQLARGDQKTRQTKGDESHANVITEYGGKSQFELKENH